MLTDSKWKISNTVKAELRKQRGWIDNQARGEELPCLTDSRLKDIKKTFLPKTHSGQVGWVEACKEFLEGKLYYAWDGISTSMALNYIDMGQERFSSFFLRPLVWENMYRLSERTAMSSNDAMILNVLESSKVPLVVSADYDLAYGILESKSDKYILVPDALYKNYLKKLKF